MIRPAVLPLLCAILGACTTIKINDDDTQTIEYEGGADVARDLTTRACQVAGQQRAEIISTANKDPALPAGSGKQVATFRCLAAEQQ